MTASIGAGSRGSGVRANPTRRRGRICIHCPQDASRSNGRCPHTELDVGDDKEVSSKIESRAAPTATATCAGRCWRPASRWRGQAGRTPSCCARRPGAPAWCRTPPTAISPAARICWRRCAPPPWPSSPTRWRRSSPSCAAASPPRRRRAPSLRAVGTGYLRFALTETGLFRTAFATPELPGFTGDPARPGESGLNPFELLSAALDELVETGLLPPERRPARGIPGLVRGPRLRHAGDRRSAAHGAARRHRRHRRARHRDGGEGHLDSGVPPAKLTHPRGRGGMSIEFLMTSLIVVASPGTGVLYTLAAGLSRGSTRQRGRGVRLHARHRAAHGRRDHGPRRAAAHQRARLPDPQVSRRRLPALHGLEHAAGARRAQGREGGRRRARRCR